MKSPARALNFHGAGARWRRLAGSGGARGQFRSLGWEPAKALIKPNPFPSMSGKSSLPEHLSSSFKQRACVIANALLQVTAVMAASRWLEIGMHVSRLRNAPDRTRFVNWASFWAVEAKRDTGLSKGRLNVFPNARPLQTNLPGRPLNFSADRLLYRAVLKF